MYWQWLPACTEREATMNQTKRIIGNHKHLTLSDRIKIEKGLNSGQSFREIAAEISKDPSTISKEVRKHTVVPERRQKDFAAIPCAHNADPTNSKRRICEMHHACGDIECTKYCRLCNTYKCSDICERYEPRVCRKLERAPYCCNGCQKNLNCLMDRKIYSAKHAQDTYEFLLRSSREGINQTPGSIQKIDALLTPLIRKGQSIGHIYATHAEDLGCSRTTLYKYIDSGVFSIGNLDLRRRVRYKVRKKPTTASLKDRSFRKGHTYEDFCNYIEENHPANIVEMDTVEGKKGTKKCLLTMLFRGCNLMLIFLLDSQTQDEVSIIFDWLYDTLGIGLFRKLFEVILTDNGSEFQHREYLEYDRWGEIRTRIFYCDPCRSNQKGALEKNHEYIRYVLPKGTSFVNLTEKKVMLLMNHINSEKRDSLNGHSPYEVSRILLDNGLHETLGLVEIPADEVMLTPALIK